MNSRTLQNLQHLIGGIYSILLMLTAAFAGMAVGKTIEWWVPLIVGIVTFLISRISSEITYQTNKALLKETHHEFAFKKLLFVCDGGSQRSPTFEIWFKKNRTQYVVKSTGTSYGYPERMTEELLRWADKIYLMDLNQEMFMKRNFPDYLHKTEIIGVSDQYRRESSELYQLIEYWVKKVSL